MCTKKRSPAGLPVAELTVNLQYIHNVDTVRHILPLADACHTPYSHPHHVANEYE